LAVTYISTCVSSGCAGDPTDIDSATSLYDAYCTSLGFKAAATVTATVDNVPPTTATVGSSPAVVTVVETSPAAISEASPNSTRLVVTSEFRLLLLLLFFVLSLGLMI
jgi:hypothetical protein